MNLEQMGIETILFYKQLGFAIAFVGATFIQVVTPHHQNIKNDFLNWRVNLPLGILNSIVLALALGGGVFAFSLWVQTNQYGLLHFIDAPLWAEIILTVLILDCVTYFWHRANHRWSTLWRFHKVHHSDINFDTSTAVRFHLGELIISFFIRLFFVFVVGISPVALLVFELIYHLCNTFEHGNISLPQWLERIIEKIIITPALHRKHHSKAQTDLDTNFATIFPFWDKIFGTYRASRSTEQFAIGLPEQVKNYGFLEILLLPLKKNNE